MEVTKDLVQWKLFPIQDWGNKEEIEQAEQQAKLFKEEHPDWSDVGHSSKGFYVGYCKAGVLAVESVKEAGEYYKLNVDLTAGYMMGVDWSSCH